MCGIAGTLSFNHEKFACLDLLRAMSDQLIHRGPDEEGFYRDRGVGLALRRLSIIDLVSGQQPMTNEDGSLVVVFNGEIYNYRELRDRLAHKHTFKTECDTEVLLHLYEEKEAGMLDDLNGMFAFALWDKKRGLLFCARDRAGQKPFFYAFHNNHFVFASELKAILKFSTELKTLDPASLSKYFAYEYIPSPHTIFKKIKKLPAAHFLKVRASGEFEIKPYWHLPLKGETNGQTTDETSERLLFLFRQAVRRQLASDVPLGAFLSGGVDSSAVVASFRHLYPKHPLSTFSIGFEEKAFDESPHAKKVAQYFNTSHFVRKINPSEVIGGLPKIIEMMDEPFSDSSIIPTYFLSHFARQRVKVALGGDGGDELFAGYPTFLGHSWLSRLDRPSLGWLKSLFTAMVSRLPVSFSNYGPEFLLKQFVRGFGHETEIANQIWLGPFPPFEQQRLFRNPENFLLDTENVFENIFSFIRKGSETNRTNRLLSYYFHFYFAEDILAKVDRASMAHSLEVRSPFLDKDFMEYAASLSPQLKLKGFCTKFIFKKAMKNILPEVIIRRRKQGFCMPLGHWFRRELKDPLMDALSVNRIKSSGLFNVGFVQRLMETHLSGQKNNWKQLWSLFVFQSWCDRHMSN